MNLMSMSFGEFTWKINPSELKVTYEKAIAERLIPFVGTKAEDLGQKRKKVIGKGFFCGEAAMNEFSNLERTFLSGEKGILILPSKQPFTVIFSQLSLIGVTAKDVVEYSFIFTECGESFLSHRAKYEIAIGGESLWDYANKHGIPIESLVRKNKHIKFINNLSKGEVVNL